MRRSRSLLLLLLVGCGGRDPLLGVNDEGFLTPPVAVGGSGGGGTATGGTGGMMTPPAPNRPDAAIPKPPAPADAAVPVMRDAAPATGVCNFPKCVAAVQDACRPVGPCVRQQVMSGGGIGTNLCFANKVKVITTISGNGRNQNVTIRVLKPDGSLCYSIDPESRGSGVTGLNYRTPSGELVATAIVERMRLLVTCTGTTTPQSVEATCQPGLTPGACTNGSCQ